MAIVLPGGPEYLEVFLAANKLRAVPVGVSTNSNIDALRAVLDGSDAKVVVCSPDMVHDVTKAIRSIPKKWRPAILEVGAEYERAIAGANPPGEWPVEEPTADDLIAVATRHVPAPVDGVIETLLPVAPLEGGPGFAEVLGVLARSGRIVFTDSRDFDARLVWQVARAEQIGTLAIGGDAFARRLLVQVPAALGDGALPSLRTITSVESPLGAEVADALEAALPGVAIAHRAGGSDLPTRGHPDAIHPSVIEARLRKHKSIADCVVLGVSDPRVGKAVVAVVEVVDNHYLDAPELAAWCRAHVPGSLTPGRFVFIEKIERSPGGDADESALRAFAIEQLSHEG